MTTKKAAKKTAAKDRWSIVGNGPYGLWYGLVRDSDATIAKTASVRLYRARSIRYWYGRKGGITSLAAHGLCGPDAGKSRIGDEIESTLVLEVKAVHACSEEAARTFAAHVNS